MMKQQEERQQVDLPPEILCDIFSYFSRAGDDADNYVKWTRKPRG